MLKESIVISKIRCSSPNFKKTALLNRNHLIYIATRPGVDLTPLKIDGKDMDEAIRNADDPGLYVKYIHERPRSHGLFGNLPDEQNNDLDALSKQLYRYSSTKNIYKGIVSLTEEDANRLGYNDINAWNTMLKATLPDVAQKLNIPIQQLSWVAAVHNEKGHPHVHYMLWRNDKKIHSPYIHTSVQDKCREIFSSYILEPDREQYIKEKTVLRDSIIKEGKEFIGYVPDIVHNQAFGKIPYDNLDKISECLWDFIRDIPKKGSLKYEYMSPDRKALIDKCTKLLLKCPQIEEKYYSFINYTKLLASTYSGGDNKQYAVVDNADKDLFKRIGNLFLKQVKEMQKAGIILQPPDEELSSFSQAEKLSPVKKTIDPQITRELELPTLTSELFSTEHTEPLAPDESVAASAGIKVSSFVRLDESNTSHYALAEFRPAVSATADTYVPIEFKQAEKYLKASALHSVENPDINKILLSLQSLAESDAPPAIKERADYLLGHIYLKESSEQYNPEIALKYLHPLAKSGNVHAQTDLGRFYLWGKHGLKDTNLGKAWLQEAARQDYQPAEKQLQKAEDMIRNKIIYFSYSLCRNVFTQLATRSNQAKAYAYEHAATESVKLRKEQQRKNQVKGTSI